MKNTEYKTILKQGYSSFEEKKSEFISNVFPVKTEQEANQYLAEIRKQYKDAVHNCFAYIIMEDGVLKERYSDDGEPSGTAGMPILEVLRREELFNVLVVVTRYFGGTLLGTGGLTRAYGRGAKDGVLASRIITNQPYHKYIYDVSYEISGKVQFCILQYNATIVDTEYTDRVIYTVYCKVSDSDGLNKEILEITSGQVDTTPVESVFGALVDGEIVFSNNN